jgi:salicylate hydroxylase
MNFIGFVERADWRVESWTVAGTTAELADDFKGWHPDVHEIIRNIGIPYKWALWGRPAMERWSVGRVSLLGDACHPTLPFLGQGAVMALEDAYVLAGCLKKYAGDHATALARYQNARRERTAAVVRAAAETRKRASTTRSPTPSGSRLTWLGNGSRGLSWRDMTRYTPTMRRRS